MTYPCIIKNDTVNDYNDDSEIEYTKQYTDTNYNCINVKKCKNINNNGKTNGINYKKDHHESYSDIVSDCSPSIFSVDPFDLDITPQRLKPTRSNKDELQMTTINCPPCDEDDDYNDELVPCVDCGSRYCMEQFDNMANDNIVPKVIHTLPLKPSTVNKKIKQVSESNRTRYNNKRKYDKAIESTRKKGAKKHKKQKTIIKNNFNNQNKKKLGDKLKNTVKLSCRKNGDEVKQLTNDNITIPIELPISRTFVRNLMHTVDPILVVGKKILNPFIEINSSLNKKSSFSNLNHDNKKVTIAKNETKENQCNVM